MVSESNVQPRRLFLFGVIAILFALFGFHPASAQTEGAAATPEARGGGTYVEFLIGDIHWDTRKWGHVSLRVVTRGEDFIFDFGRYGKMDGYKKSEGDPILRIWQPGTYETYRQSHLKDGGVTRRYRFPSTDARNGRILAYFTKLSPGGLRNHGTYKWVVARVNEGTSDPKLRRFHAVLVNCTTVSIDGFMAGFPEYDLKSPNYSVARDLNAFIRGAGQKEELGYQNGHWSRVWWPHDLMALLNEQFVSRGLARVTVM